ncbi:MAG: apolipoprotein N-acyltransferase [Candidatus Electrothrix sp. LOE1_4_5]|nr:apolipoprotein N-acyltransferase [Candidatus Electrothrix gigas]
MAIVSISTFSTPSTEPTEPVLQPLRGCSPYIRALFSAVLLTVAMPGKIGWWPFLFVALLPLLSTLGRLSVRQSILTGIVCGMFFYTGLLYWISPVLQRYGGMHPVVTITALFALVVYMTTYLCLFCCLGNSILILRCRSKGTSTALLLLAAPTLWVGLDFLRGTLFTGIPWMDIGYALYRQPLLIQAADLGGHHVITFAVVLINALLLWLISRIQTADAAASGYHFAPPVVVFLLLAFLGGYSTVRYQQIVSKVATADTAFISAVQGNIQQNIKWVPSYKEKTIDQYLLLSRQIVTEETEKPDLFVWPETALPFYPAREPLMNKVLDFVWEKDILLLTGSPFFTVKPTQRKKVAYYNSALLLDRTGSMSARYNKQHLVPFGEYVPLRHYLWFLKPLVEVVGNFTAGDSSQPLDGETIQVGVLICFESLFPNIARKEVAEGANLLANLTNDAWYGRSVAPDHSWAMTVFRSVENRRSLVRAANTGISGFVSPTGEILQETELFKAKAISARIPLMTLQSVFVRGGHHFDSICLFLALILLHLAACRHQKNKKIRRCRGF